MWGGGSTPSGDRVFPRHSLQALPWSSDGSGGHGMAVDGVTPAQTDEAFPVTGTAATGSFSPAGIHMRSEPQLRISSAADEFSDERQNFLCS